MLMNRPLFETAMLSIRPGPEKPRFILVARRDIASNRTASVTEKPMNSRSPVAKILAAISVLLLSATAACADNLKVVASVALTSVLGDLLPAFDKKTGNKTVADFALAADVKKRILAGERADVIILTPAMMEDLAKQAKVTADSLVRVAGTPVAVAARAGATKPDISTVEAFKLTLLTSASIVYSDPAKGGLSGIVAARTMDRLGIADEMKSRTILVPGAESLDMVAKGEAELGIAQASEIVPVKGVQLVGPLPGELATMTVFTGGVGADSPSATAAKALIDFLRGPDAAAALKANGFDPG
jgi:molybdate transport system substrate-binding protein